MSVKKLGNSLLIGKIVIPFLVTRFALLVIGFLSPRVFDFQYGIDQEIANRGWLFTPIRAVDMWARWDSGWYMSVIHNGYRMGENVYTASNLPFFPGFPLLVKVLHDLLIPSYFSSDSSVIIVGLLVSNLLLIGSLWLVYQLAQHYFGDEKISRRSVWYALVFPTSFFLSSFYSESTFLFFALLSFWLAVKKKWLLACIVASLAAATRPNGILVSIPIFFEYLRARQWSWKKIDLHVLAFAVCPIGLLLFCFYMYTLTGDFLATFKAHSAWGRSFADVYTTFFHPRNVWPIITQIDRVMAILIGVTGALILKMKQRPELLPLGVYTLLILVSFIFSGTLDSVSRFAAIVWPVYVFWSAQKKSLYLEYIVMGMAFSMQLYLFARFTQVFWVG